jgi:molybdenum cofactor guanylyltransferase
VTRIAAVILAGGRGERLGGANKALLDIGGTRLIDQALAAVAGYAPVLVAAGSNELGVPGARTIRDLDADYGGPLAGVAAAVAALSDSDAELLLSLAVDTPFFPHDFCSRALPALEHALAVIGAFGAQDYPTNGLWQLAALRDLPARVRAGTAPHSLKRVAADLGAARLDYALWATADPFANANTPADLAALRARAMVERES